MDIVAHCVPPVVSFELLQVTRAMLSENLITNVCGKTYCEAAWPYSPRFPVLRYLRMLEKWPANEEDGEEGREAQRVEKRNSRK